MVIYKREIRFGKRKKIYCRNVFRLPDYLPDSQMPPDILTDGIKVVDKKNSQKAEEKNENSKFKF